MSNDNLPQVLSDKVSRLEYITLDELIIIQGDLKSLSKTAYEKFKKLMLEVGFADPFKIWIDGSKKKILDGTQRSRTLKMMREEGISLPERFPAIVIEASDEFMARKILLGLTSNFGKMSDESLSDYAIESGIDLDWISSTIELPFTSGIEVDTSESSNDKSNPLDSEYTSKIKPPIYEPKGPKPSIKELYDLTKAESLIQEIKQSSLPEEEKEFLTFAAYRHVVFNYEKAAEYYAHSAPEAQDLMENSALVIIDFNKAIENGFVSLSEKIAEAYKAEVDNEE